MAIIVGVSVSSDHSVSVWLQTGSRADDAIDYSFEYLIANTSTLGIQLRSMHAIHWRSSESVERSERLIRFRHKLIRNSKQTFNHMKSRFRFRFECK